MQAENLLPIERTKSIVCDFTDTEKTIAHWKGRGWRYVGGMSSNDNEVCLTFVSNKNLGGA